MKLQLNFNKPGNYAFFCPVSRVHLTRSNPVAFVDEVTPYIKRGLKTKAIIEVDAETTGQKANTKKEETKKQEPMPEQKESTPSVEAPVQKAEEPVEAKVETEEAPAEEPKKGRKKASSK